MGCEGYMKYHMGTTKEGDGHFEHTHVRMYSSHFMYYLTAIVYVPV